MIVKYSKEVADFIEAYGASNDEGYYWFPYYFKKIGDCLFESVVFSDLPRELKHIVERSEPLGPKEVEL